MLLVCYLFHLKMVSVSALLSIIELPAADQVEEETPCLGK